MKTVSFQGVQLTSGQRHRLEQQRRIKSVFNPLLGEQVAQTIAVLEVRKEQGTQPEKQWVTIIDTRGTVSIAEWMGY
ncbi:hypothetical protein IAE35_24470 [Pseudomonas sp. S75]|uniref:hypothetical protein n=1 Tax=unclassified Pseudomonas TaxID=196821 RepID=UPI001902F4A7|nr:MULTISPECIES: hypothetical protein [unclassified Pseudomonas]MBJ9975199.1 hypothetical protein [Pseudomonas sp. S30]MBK0156499.1 hypothetical protein [Pseudomonas sp. S75]